MECYILSLLFDEELGFTVLFLLNNLKFKMYIVLVEKTTYVSLTEYKAPGVACLCRFVISRAGLRLFSYIEE